MAKQPTENQNDNEGSRRDRKAVLKVSAPAGPRRRAGIAFGPVPVPLREEDLGDDPDKTIALLRADPMLKLDAGIEDAPADD